MHRFLHLILVAAMAICILPTPSVAQMGAIRAMGGMTTPSINARQLRQYSEILGLSPDQKKAAEELLTGYEAEYLAAVSRLTELQKGLQEEFAQTGDFTIMQDVMGDAFKKFRKRIDKTEKGLIDDLQAILTADQTDRWPLVERLHRRKNTINWGSLSGESVDLVEIVDGLRLAPSDSAGVKETLDLYSIDLDRELVARNKLVDEQVATWLEGMMNPDMEKIQAQQKDLRSASEKILALNKRYARQLEGQLPPDVRQEFVDRVLLSSYPVVYRKSHTLRSIEIAEKFEGLDPATAEALKNLKDQYGREIASANKAWADAITENENSEKSAQEALAAQFTRQMPENVKTAKEARDAIDEKTMTSLRALLTEEQQKKLPDRKFRPEFDYDAATSVK